MYLGMNCGPLVRLASRLPPRAAPGPDRCGPECYSAVLSHSTAPATGIYTFKTSPFSSHALLLKVLPANGQGRRLLDAGCAAGHIARLLSQRGFSVTGVERPGGCVPPPDCFRLIEADLDSGLPYLGTQYEYVLCADVLEHLRDPLRLLTDIKTVLTPGGTLVASLPNSGNIWFRLNILFGRFPQEDKGLFDRTHLRFYMWAGWKELLHQAGFNIVQVEPTGIPVGLTMPKLEGSFAVRMAERVCYGMARIWPKLFAYQFVVCARPGSKHGS